MNQQKNEGSRLIAAIHDQDKSRGIKTFQEVSNETLLKLNQQGYGIFETVNEFTGGKRKAENLSRLIAVYADMDVCKEEKPLPEKEREHLKEQLLKAVNEYCPASYYTVTKNGLQPHWLIDEPKVDEETVTQYQKVIEGIIEWSKQHGSLGDPVKDVARLLRKPGFYHQKSEPYLVTQIDGNGKVYTLAELQSLFPLTQKQQVIPKQESDNQIFQEINNLDIRQVVVDVWADCGHEAHFDEKHGHLFVDGKRTATFKGRLNDGNFIATTSSEYPAKGNAITYVAETLGITNKEAYRWLVDRYNLRAATFKNTEGLDEKKMLKIQFEESDHRKIVIQKIAELLIKAHSIKTINGKKDRELLIYRDGIYVSGENYLKSEVTDILKEQTTNHYTKEIIERVKNMTLVERSAFNVSENLINLNNCVLDIDTMTVSPHSSRNLFLTKIPINYEPDADCPEIKNFFQQILGESYIPVIQEWFGYCLYRSYFVKKAVIMYGEPDTGKTTLLRLLEAFIGKDNMSGVSLHKLTKDKFSAAHLYQKHVNAFDDLSSDDINDTGAFKIATGNGSITGEYKFGDQFQFSNTAKLIFACNTIPSVKEVDDDAYFIRWIVVPFSRIIEKKDKHLAKKLTDPKELSGLLNFALEGLERLRKEQDFSYDKKAEEIKEEMMRSSSAMANFAYDRLMEKSDAWISKQSLYHEFADYARANGYAVDTIKFFGMHLRKYAPYISDSRSGNTTGWRNVALKQDVQGHFEDI